MRRIFTAAEIPAGQVLVESLAVKKHTIHILHVTHIPLTNILIKRLAVTLLVEKNLHRRHVGNVPILDGSVF